MKPRLYAARLRRTPTSSSPLMQEFHSIVNQTPIALDKICDRAGVAHGTIQQWRSRDRNPSLFLFECVLNTLGYELIIRKKGTKE
jgi:hypothetical protein